MKRLAVISDIHGNILALEAVVADIKRKNVDTIVNLGDHISGPLWPKETIEFLMQQEWIQILGNHDRQLIQQEHKDHGLSDKYAFQYLDNKEIEWLHSLPPQIVLNQGILAIHGTPQKDTEYLLETVENGRLRLSSREEIKSKLTDTTFQVLLCGHSHVPRIVFLSDDKIILNPGSVGLQAYEDDYNGLHITELGSPNARYSILEYTDNSWYVENVVIPYKHNIAALQARKNSRTDWEIALETGFMKK